MTTRQDGIGDRGLAEDLETSADDAGSDLAQSDVLAFGRVVLQAEALKDSGGMTAETFRAIRFKAASILAGDPESKVAELMASLDALDPKRRVE